MNKNSLRDSIAQDFVAALNEDQLPWQKMWAKQRAYNAATGNDYHGINAMWLAWQASQKGYEDPRWCTYKQSQDNGWQVRKGEKGTTVEFWSLYDTKTRKTISMEEADKLVREDPDRKDDLTYITKRASVFNAQQIDGIPKLERPVTVDMDTISAQRDTLLKNMGVGLREGGDEAYYQPASDTIAMPSGSAFQSDYAYMSVLLHEAGHATGHESRLNRDLSGTFGTESYAKEELRAEIASAFTAQALGMHGNDDEPAMQSYMANHKAYIQSWAKAIQDAPQELFAAIRDAEKISDYLIEKGEFERAPKAEIAMSPEVEQKVIAALEDRYVPEDMRGLYDALHERVSKDSPELSGIEKACVAMSVMQDEDIIGVSWDTMANELYELHAIDEQRDYSHLAQYFDCAAIVQEAREYYESEHYTPYSEDEDYEQPPTFEEHMQEEYGIDEYDGTDEQRAVALLNDGTVTPERYFQKDKYLQDAVNGQVYFGGELVHNQKTGEVYTVPNISYEWAGPYLEKAQELRKGIEQEQKQNAGKAVVEELLQKAYARTGDSRAQGQTRDREHTMTH